jgi:RNA polymerase sigma-70 factor (ECF subfamily)
MADGSHSDLVERARAGSATAFEALVRQYFRAAYAVALAVVRNPAEAEDLTQEAFLVAFEQLHTCREPERFAHWLFQVVRNRAKNRASQTRGRERALQALPEAGSDEQLVSNTGLKARLLAALDHVSEVQREVVLLHDLEGFTHGEIAAALDLSEAMSRQHLFQARKKLRELLEPDAPER